MKHSTKFEPLGKMNFMNMTSICKLPTLNVLLLSLLVTGVQVCLSPSIRAESFLGVGATHGSIGEEKIVPVYLQSDVEIVAAQFTISYNPQELTLGEMVDGSALVDHESQVHETSRSDELVVMRVTIFSHTNQPLNDGSIFDIAVTLKKETPEGTKVLDLQNVLLINKDTDEEDFSDLVPLGALSIDGIQATAITGKQINFKPSISTYGTLPLDKVSYHWDFGDGKSSMDSSPSHTYSVAGVYEVSLVVMNPISSASSNVSITVTESGELIMISGLEHYADGYPKSVTVKTNPPSLPVDVTYDGSNQAPKTPGSYHVVVTINDPNYNYASVGVTMVIRSRLNEVFTGLEVVGDGWHRADWFGFLHDEGYGWTYHTDHGWIYPKPEPSSEDSLWMYWPEWPQPNEGVWVWTSREVYPKVFKTATVSEPNPNWLYFYESSSDPLLFYDYGIEYLRFRFVP